MQPLTSSEASVWLREILSPLEQSSVQNLATHSAKATILSWMSKANVSLSLRRLAGYHVVPGDKSALEYSRDAASPILRQIEAIFISTRAGIFFPDRSRARRRSGAQNLEDSVKLASVQKEQRLMSSMSCPSSDAFPTFDQHDDFGFGLSEPLQKSTDKLEPQDASKCVESVAWHDDMTLEELGKLKSPQVNLGASFQIQSDLSDASDMSDSVSSSCDDESDSDDEQRRVMLDGERNARDLVAPSDIAGKTCYKHAKSQRLHFVGKCIQGVNYFKCGRKCNENYVLLECVPAFTAHGCLTCFGWKLNDDLDSASS